MSESLVTDVNNIKSVAVLGAGTMGHGIAQVAAMAGVIQIRTEIPGPKSRALLTRRAAAVPRGVPAVTPRNSSGIQTVGADSIVCCSLSWTNANSTNDAASLEVLRKLGIELRAVIVGARGVDPGGDFLVLQAGGHLQGV